MSKRFTDTDKWKDPWFRSLSPHEKLLFNYLCDNCDLAGFYEVDFDMIAFTTKLTEKETKDAFRGLIKGYTGNDGWIWINNFLKHQKNLPLNPANNAHKCIINLIQNQLKRFPNIPQNLGANQGLFSPIGKGNSKGIGRVKVDKPETKIKKSLEELCEPFKEKYKPEVITAFLRYWDEKNDKGVSKWEMQKTWETGKRLATWSENDFGNKKSALSTPIVHKPKIFDKTKYEY
jgi:hypothetical protein